MASTVKKIDNKTANVAPESIGALWAASASMTIFWVFIILKEAYSGVETILNFYKPVGPLLGLFGLAMLTFAAVYFVGTSKVESSSKKSAKQLNNAVILFVLATILVFFMTFPPIFKPIVHLIEL